MEMVAKAGAQGIAPVVYCSARCGASQVEDIIDTGATLKAVIAKLRDLGAASVKSAVLLNKEERRNIKIEPDYMALKVRSARCLGTQTQLTERTAHR